MKFLHFGHKNKSEDHPTNPTQPGRLGKAVTAAGVAAGLAVTGGVAASGEAPKPADAVVTVGGTPTPENPNTEVTAPTTTPTTEAPTTTTPTTEVPVTTTTNPDTPVSVPTGENPGPIVEDPTTPTSVVLGGGIETSITAPGLTDPSQTTQPTVPKDPQSQLPSST